MAKYKKAYSVWENLTRENYMHVCKHGLNVHRKIYNVYKTYVHITYWTNKWFLNFVWLIIYLYFCILVYPLFTIQFVQAFFSHIQKYCPLKFVWFDQEYSIFLIESVWNLGGNNLSFKPLLYLHHFCFDVIHQSYQVLLKVSDKLHIKVLAGALLH